MERIEIKSQSLPELKQTMESLGEKGFRAKQLYEWMHRKLAEDFDEMSNLSIAAGKAKGTLYADISKSPGSTDFQDRWNTEISVCPGRWQCGRKCAYEI